MNRAEIVDKIREDVCEELLAIQSMFNKIKSSYARQAIDDVDHHISLINQYQIGNDLILFRNTSSLVKKQMYTDYYRIIRYKSKIGNSDGFMIKLDDKQIDIIYYNSFLFPDVITAMMHMHEFTEFDKILINRSLIDDDIKYLESINPFFKGEYDYYNRKIDLEFIKKQIEEVRGIVEPYMEYYYAANQIFMLNKIDEVEAKQIIKQLVDESNFEIKESNIKEETINVANHNISTKDLSFLLLEYCKRKNEKKLKYKKGDNGEHK